MKLDYLVEFWKWSALYASATINYNILLFIFDILKFQISICCTLLGLKFSCNHNADDSHWGHKWLCCAWPSFGEGEREVQPDASKGKTKRAWMGWQISYLTSSLPYFTVLWIFETEWNYENCMPLPLYVACCWNCIQLATLAWN